MLSLSKHLYRFVESFSNEKFVADNWLKDKVLCGKIGFLG